MIDTHQKPMFDVSFLVFFESFDIKLRSSHRDSFRKYLFFFSRSNLFIIFQVGPFVPRTDMNFPEGSICLSNRHEFSRRVYMFFEQTPIFQEGFPKRHVFSSQLVFKEVLSVVPTQTDSLNHTDSRVAYTALTLFIPY